MKNNLFKKIVIRVIVYSFLILCAFVWIFSSVLIRAYRPGGNTSPSVFNIPFEDVSLKTNDGLELSGWWIPSRSKEKNKPAVIFCHGLGADKADMVNFIPFLYKNGYNILMFDFRGHGENKSNNTSLGYFETNDLLSAVDFVKSKGIGSIGVLGVSMGASVAIMTAEKTNDIKALVADCGFASLAPMLDHYAKKFYHINFTPFISLVKWVSEIRLGCDYSKVNPVESIKNVKVPVFIIHGEKDGNIPVENADLLYKAANEPKKIMIVPNAAHVESHSTAQKQYEEEVLKFFQKYLKSQG